MKLLQNFLFIFIFFLSSFTSSSTYSLEYLIGTYYYPGWIDNVSGSVTQYPWNLIKKDFSIEKKPKLGWYDNSDTDVMRKQVDYMIEGGLGFVVFDWYWKSETKSTYLDQALNAFKTVKTPGEMKFSILWSNHYTFSGGVASFEAMVSSWISDQFSDPDYLTIDGKPVVFVFSVEDFYYNAKQIGLTPAELIILANNLAKQAGYLNGIYFVGGTPALSYWTNIAATAGFDALSSYNYHIGYLGEATTSTGYSHSYSELSANYDMNWRWLIKLGPLPYIIPMTVGWDKRPWGGSADPLHDNSISTPEQFKTHLTKAKYYMDTYPEKTNKIGVVCCWNEFGEGSYIEPTEKYDSIYLQQIPSVFNGN